MVLFLADTGKKWRSFLLFCLVKSRSKTVLTKIEVVL
jgi:hypothetical protein